MGNFGRELFQDAFYTFKRGLVCLKVYNEFNALRPKDEHIFWTFSSEQAKFIKDTIIKFSSFSEKQLMFLAAHTAPFRESSFKISNKYMITYFKERRKNGAL